MREKSLHRLSLWAALFFGLSILSVHQLMRIPNKRITPLSDFYISDEYIQDLGSVMLGARRMAADLAYIQMMQYYGENLHGDPAIMAQAALLGHDEDRERLGGGAIDRSFKALVNFGYRIVRLDPLFNSAILEISGALAFNQQRPEEALQLLREAIVRDPSFYRYHLYVSAILYKGKGADQQLIHVLDEAIKYPDCPHVLKNILANLHKKYGDFEAAAHIYINILETSQIESERNEAQGNLEKLLKAHPELMSLPQLRRN